MVKEAHIHSFACGYPDVPHHLLKFIFSLLNFLGTLVEHQLTINMDHFFSIDLCVLSYATIDLYVCLYSRTTLS